MVSWRFVFDDLACHGMSWSCLAGVSTGDWGRGGNSYLQLREAVSDVFSASFVPPLAIPCGNTFKFNEMLLL